jgi:hypothetical protein
MKLDGFDLAGCDEIQDFEPLRALPLTHLWINDCPHVRDLEPLRGKKLIHLGLIGCPQVRDLSPLEGMPLKGIDLTPRFIQKGMDVLRGLKSLESVNVKGNRFEAAEFWRLYDKGEFDK